MQEAAQKGWVAGPLPRLAMTEPSFHSPLKSFGTLP
jgi:hypothetical protein